MTTKTKPPKDTLQLALEAHIDDTNLCKVLTSLSDICMAKRDHIEAEYHDATHAAQWSEIGIQIKKLAQTAHRRKL